MGTKKIISKKMTFIHFGERLESYIVIWILIDNIPGRVPRKMVKFNPGLSEILSTVFLLRACNSSLQNAVQPLL